MVLIENRKTGFIKTGFIFLFAMLSIVSCGKSGQNHEKLIYWSANNPYEIEFARKIVKEWNMNNPNIPVQFQPVPEGRSSEEIILAAVVGKTTPDIYSNMWQGDVENYAQAGVLVPLDTIPGFLDSLYARTDSAVVDEVTSNDGHIYQIPWKINPIMLIYNQKMLKKIGYENPPSTYSDYFAAAEKIKEDINHDGYVDRWIGYSEILVTWWQRLFDFYPIYLAASGGGKLVDGNDVVFDNKHAVDTFTFLRTLYEKQYFAREMLSARQDVFLGGIIATRFTGPWEITHAEKFKPEGFEYSFAPLPVPDNHEGDAYTYGDPKNLVIFNTCPQPEKAVKFLNFMVNRQNDLRFLQMTNQLPRRKRLFEDAAFSEYFKNNPKMIPFARQSRFVKGTDSSPVLREIFDLISMEYEACVIYGTKTPEQAVRDAADAARLLVN